MRSQRVVVNPPFALFLSSCPPSKPVFPPACCLLDEPDTTDNALFDRRHAAPATSGPTTQRCGLPCVISIVCIIVLSSAVPVLIRGAFRRCDPPAIRQLPRDDAVDDQGRRPATNSSAACLACGRDCWGHRAVLAPSIGGVHLDSPAASFPFPTSHFPLRPTALAISDPSPRPPPPFHPVPLPSHSIPVRSGSPSSTGIPGPLSFVKRATLRLARFRNSAPEATPRHTHNTAASPTQPGSRWGITPPLPRHRALRATTPAAPQMQAIALCSTTSSSSSSSISNSNNRSSTRGPETPFLCKPSVLPHPRSRPWPTPKARPRHQPLDRSRPGHTAPRRKLLPPRRPRHPARAQSRPTASRGTPLPRRPNPSPCPNLRPRQPAVARQRYQ